MPAEIINKIEISASTEDLFNYITQPWFWHEWHPSSKSAKSVHSFLATGDEFEEFIEVQPLSPLPPRLVRSTRYTVTETIPFQSWEAEGKMKDGWLRIRYDIEEPEEPGGNVFFQRTLTFDASGPTRLLLPFLKKNMLGISHTAMENLKARFAL